MKNKIPLKLGIMPNDFGLIANIEGANKLAVPKYLFWSTGLSLLCWIVIAGSMAVSIHFFYHYPDNGFAIVCAYALGWLYIWFFAIPIFTLYALLLSAIFLCKNCMGK